MNCPRCQTENPPGARFCLDCGATLIPRCANCQMELPASARFCMNCGQPVVGRTPIDDARLDRLAAAAPAQLVEKVRAAARLAGEQRTVTALFVDIVGSTALAQQVGAQDWAAIMNDAFDRCHPPVYRYEGTIAHLMGDELLAFFGAPIAHEDDPVRAVRAALDLLDAMREYAEKVRQRHGVEFAVRVSLSTGPVVVGPVDGDLKYEYSALGGGINLAARVELTKRPMAVLISEETYPFVAPFFDCIDLGLMEVEYTTEPVHVYEVRGPRAEPGREHGLIGLESPMVGRAAELATLLQLSETVRAGLGRAVLIIGEPGMGKTRLTAEWQAAEAAASSEPCIQWARGRCLSYSRELAYHLLLDLLRSLIGVPSGADEPQVRAALFALTQDLFGLADPAVSYAQASEAPSAPFEQNEGLEVYAALGHLLSLKLETWALERVRRLAPEALRAQYLAALRQLLRALATRRPLVLVLENLHWADPSSIDLLMHLLPLASSAPLLFCLVTRPDRDAPGWQLIAAAREILGGTLVELTLEALSERDSRQLVSNLLGLEDVPEQIQVAILQKAEGNPFFVEEVIRMLIDRGAILQKDGKWVTGAEMDGAEIPDNLQRLLLARIDRLPDGVEYTLRVASVIGRRFPVRVLKQVVDDEEARAALVSHLSQLESAGLIRVDQISPELTYRFRNVLVQDATYASLLTTDRQRLHLAVGEALERMYPEQLTSRELAPMLAQHFSEAGDEPRALYYFALAGEAALASYANREAERHYRRALALARRQARPESEQADLLFGLGEALYRQSRFRDAIQIWSEGIELYKIAGNSDGLARLYARSARAVWYDGDRPEGLRLCQEGLEAVAGAPESPGIATLVHEAARAHFFAESPPAQVRQLCQQALEMAERLGAVQVQADALATLGVLTDQQPEEALQALRKAVELAESAGLLVQARRAHNNLAGVLVECGADFQAARDHYQRAAELSRQAGSVEGELIALSNMAGAALWTGDFERVEATFPALRQLLTEAANPGPAAAGLRINETLLLRYRGELTETVQRLQECHVQAQQRAEFQHLLQCTNHLAEILLESGIPEGGTEVIGWEEIEAMLTEAIEISDRGQIESGVWSRCLLGMVRAQQGRLKDAHYLLAEAREVASQRPSPLDEGWLAWAEAQVATAEERWAEALTSFEAVTRHYARLGIRWWWARALQEWAEAHVARGEPADLERARALLREALALFEELDTPYYATQVQEKLQIVNAAIYVEMLARHEVAQELAVASRIQESFLPEEVPQIDGWQLAVTLESARETSGDFYDFIPLPNKRWGLLVADVADKGVGAALYMALCRTLMRTYAGEFGMQPELTLSAVNGRILTETHSDMFVTMFYAVFDPLTATLTYCNAGHPPPYLFRVQGGSHSSIEARPLSRTGMAMGVVRDATWDQGTVQIDPGDVLVIYSDGVTEAHNAQEALFGEERVLQILQDTLLERASVIVPPIRVLLAQDVLDALLVGVRSFVSSAPQSDDITVMVLVRTE